MHELSLAQGICDTVSPLVEADQRVVSIVVEVGPLSGVQPEALEYCFAIVAEQAGLSGAALDLVSLDARASCPACSEDFVIRFVWDACPGCGHSPVTVEGGREFRIKEFEVDDV